MTSAELDFCHPREGGDPDQGESRGVDTPHWIPAFAGMTNGETIVQILRRVQQALTHVAQENAALEVRLLAQHAWGLNAEQLLRDSDRTVDVSQLVQLEQLVTRRLMHEPISQIVGYKDFWKDQFRVTRDVLTPRADSECMIEALIRLQPDHDAPLKILELGVGSGCLLLSALREYPNATGAGVDISVAAIGVAIENANKLGLVGRAKFFEGSWCKPLDKADGFDIILMNPPYIAHAEIAHLMPDVQGFEPHLALDGGDDGLQCYHAIFAQIRPHMHAGTRILVEIGENQTNDVTEIAAAQGLACREIIHDLGGKARVLVVTN